MAAPEALQDAHDPRRFEEFQQVTLTHHPDAAVSAPEDQPEAIPGIAFTFPAAVRTKEDLADFFGWLRQVREATTALTQYNVAEAMGATQGVVSGLENGLTNSRITTILGYLSALDGWEVTMVLTRREKPEPLPEFTPAVLSEVAQALGDANPEAVSLARGRALFSPEERWDTTSSEDHPLRLLSQLRTDAGLTQDQVAALMGTSQAIVSSLERGKTRAGVVTLQRVLQALNVDWRLVLTADTPAALDRFKAGDLVHVLRRSAQSFSADPQMLIADVSGVRPPDESFEDTTAHLRQRLADTLVVAPAVVVASPAVRWHSQQITNEYRWLLNGLRQAYVEAGHSQTAIAKTMGATQSSVSDLEAGRTKNPSADMLSRYARAAGFTLIWTFIERDPPAAPIEEA